MIDTTKAQKAMDKCKYKIITNADHTFIMSIMFGMKFEWREEGIWAGATDGETIFLNPKFFLSIDNQYRTFLLLHETYHVVFKHCIRAQRMPHLNHKKMNAAEDYMINLIIHDEMGWHPQDCLFDEKYRGLSSMEIYKRLPDNAEPPEEDVLPVPVSDGDGEKQAADEFETNINMAIITASVAHEKKNNQAPGAMGESNSLGRYLDDLMNPTIDWLPLARKHMTKYNNTKLSLKRPNRRYLGHRMVMPSRTKTKGMEDICIYCDSSGSVTPKELNEYVAFVRHMQKQLKPDNLYIKSFDDSLHEGGVYKRREQIPAIELQGGGGTDIQKVINDCFAINPKLVVVFTDGYFYPQTQTEVPFDLLWIILDNPKFTSNIGRIIHHTTK